MTPHVTNEKHRLNDYLMGAGTILQGKLLFSPGINVDTLLVCF